MRLLVSQEKVNQVPLRIELDRLVVHRPETSSAPCGLYVTWHKSVRAFVHTPTQIPRAAPCGPLAPVADEGQEHPLYSLHDYESKGS